MLQHPIAAHRNRNYVSLFDYCIFFKCLYFSASKKYHGEIRRINNATPSADNT